MKPYYEHAGITIYHGDCREVLSSEQAQSQVLITDPPYGLNLGKHEGTQQHGSGYLGKQGYASYEDSNENLREIVAPTISKLVKRSIRSCVFCAGGKIGAFPEPSCVGGIYMPNAVGRNSWGFQNLIFILFYGAGAWVHKGCRATTLVSTDSTEKNGHPCPKPLSWMRWLTEMATREGEIVLDPFMGSGTTLRAAKDLGLKAIGIEIEEKYCEIAARRLEQEVFNFDARAEASQ